jgi:hypothetical protein
VPRRGLDVDSKQPNSLLSGGLVFAIGLLMIAGLIGCACGLYFLLR